MIFSTTPILLTCIALAWPTNESVHQAHAIDEALQRIHQRENIVPGEIVGDMHFLRRASLDLFGRIPTVAEIEAFQQNPDRNALIDHMIGSPEFPKFIAEAWSIWLVGYTEAFETDREAFRIWLEDQIASDRSFKDIVNKILTAKGSVAINGPANFLARHFDQPTSAVCRSFLGVRLECAQCHDHPFDRWTQQDYKLMSRFFDPMRRDEKNGVVSLSDELGDFEELDRPKFLTGARTRTGRYRQELALYLTNCKPFERNFANRCWYQLMGRGIVDPPDDFNQENTPSDRQFLELMAEQARDSNFNIRKMFRTICKTNAYQRQSATIDDPKNAIEHFAYRTVKPLLPVQFIDSLLTGLNRSDKAEVRRQVLDRLTNRYAVNEDFQRLWDYQESIQQLMQNMTFQFRGDAGQRSTKLSTDQIYMRLLTRKPTAIELRFCQNKKPADIMFVLALSNEFCFNH